MKQFLTVRKPELNREGELRKVSPANNALFRKETKKVNLLSYYKNPGSFPSTRIVAFLYLKMRPIRRIDLNYVFVSHLPDTQHTTI